MTTISGIPSPSRAAAAVHLMHANDDLSELAELEPGSERTKLASHMRSDIETALNALASSENAPLFDLVGGRLKAPLGGTLTDNVITNATYEFPRVIHALDPTIEAEG
jgi:hypothetical protein